MRILNIPGMVISAKGLINQNSDPTRAQAAHATATISAAVQATKKS